jgi:anti-sigma B factor antagonist
VPVDDPQFSASVVYSGRASVVAVEGPMDLYAAPELKAMLAVQLADHAGRLVLDLTATTFVDSTGLAVLVAAHRRAERLGGRLVVVNVDDEIARLLTITGLDTILATATDREGALGQLA